MDDHLLESAVVAQRAMVGEIEPVVWRPRPGVIANQLVLMVHCFKAVSIDEATQLRQQRLNSGLAAG